MQNSKLRVGVIGGLGLMASPMAVHWKADGPVQVVTVHDRGTRSERHDKNRARWRTHGATLVGTFRELLSPDLDGVFICVGKNADDYPILQELFSLLKNSQKFICHMSTVSTLFAQKLYLEGDKAGVKYVNYPLTGGAVGAEKGSMLILASGERKLYDRLAPALEKLGRPEYFGEGAAKGAEVKLMSHMMVFNNLMGIASAVASHTEAFRNGKFGGQEQAEFFDFLNTGAGGSKQWDLIMNFAVRNEIWAGPFFLKHAAVDVIYTVELVQHLGVSFLVAENLINVALAFSFVMNEYGADMGTQCFVREIVKARAKDFDAFALKHSGKRGDVEDCLRKCVNSFPANVQRTVGR